MNRFSATNYPQGGEEEVRNCRSRERHLLWLESELYQANLGAPSLSFLSETGLCGCSAVCTLSTRTPFAAVIYCCAREDCFWLILADFNSVLGAFVNEAGERVGKGLRP